MKYKVLWEITELSSNVYPVYDPEGKAPILQVL